MNAQNYIQKQLDDLNKPIGQAKVSPDKIADEIARLILSKKFRKYSISDEQREHINQAVCESIKKNRPIQTTFVFGGYKLWRLDESPEADWAELFSMMYYTKWLKPICEIYEPGVWFDFFSDDVIVPILNNVNADGVRAYGANFKKLLEFIEPYQPKNLSMTLTRVADQYDSDGDFQKDLEEQIAKLKDRFSGGLPELNDTARATLELNVKTTEEQANDPQWREKVQLLHDAYAYVSKRRPYYRNSDKIIVFPTPTNGALCLGTTKDSVMKFWIGAGVLKPNGDSFRQLILSPSQLDSYKFEAEDISIADLKSKNFSKIKIIQDA